MDAWGWIYIFHSLFFLIPFSFPTLYKWWPNFSWVSFPLQLDSKMPVLPFLSPSSKISKASFLFVFTKTKIILLVPGSAPHILFKASVSIGRTTINRGLIPRMLTHISSAILFLYFQNLAYNLHKEKTLCL